MMDEPCSMASTSFVRLLSYRSSLPLLLLVLPMPPMAIVMPASTLMMLVATADHRRAGS